MIIRTPDAEIRLKGKYVQIIGEASDDPGTIRLDMVSGAAINCLFDADYSTGNNFAKLRGKETAKVEEAKG